MTNFLIIGSISTEEEVTEVRIIAKNAIVRRRIKEIARGVHNE